MNAQDAVALLAPAFPGHAGAWADFGAGDGTFTAALARLLGPGSTIYAVDRNVAALKSLKRLPQVAGVDVLPIVGDFTQPLELPGAARQGLDGMLFANALHFVPDPEVVLGRLVTSLRPGGHVVIVEYARRAASRWVPYPIEPARLGQIAAAAGLSEPSITATRPSSYGGNLYVARLDSVGKGALSK